MVRPRLNSDGQKELDKAEEQLSSFESQVKEIVDNREDIKSYVPECEPQTKLSQRDIKSIDAPYIKPMRSINSKERFNEKYRKEHTQAWQYVKCVVENNELLGSSVETWTKKFPGDPAHFWMVPVNKPIMIPRLLAKQLSECKYHRLRMDEHQVTQNDAGGSYYGAMVADHVKERISCRELGTGF